jgi:sigma-E factor negative regulatory protein RseB
MIRRSRAPLVRGAAAALLALASLAAQAGQSRAHEWVQRMNKAVVESNYDGVFTRHSGEAVENMHIIHRFKGGEMVERVISMDNSGYEQKRKGSSWAEFLPHKQLVQTATRNRIFGYIPTLNGLDEQSARHYDISDAGVARLLGRDVQRIQILPRDNLRLGYHLWIDHQSALPLKFQRVTYDGKVVKEFAFVSPPSLPADIADEQLKVAVDFRPFRWVNMDHPLVNPALKRSYLPQAALLPAGYRVPRFNRPAPGPVGPRARFIISDGISWGEIFIAPPDDKAKPDGGAVMGPMASYRLRLDDAQVIVVGEMPLAAAKAIAEAVRPE